MYEDQQSPGYKVYETERIKKATDISEPFFCAKDKKTWQTLYSAVMKRVIEGHIQDTTQGQIFLLAQRWGLAIDMRTDLFPEINYQSAGLAAADSLEQALTGAQASKALALLVATHEDGDDIARQIIEEKGKKYKRGYVFDYSTRKDERIVIELAEFSQMSITPPYYSNTSPSDTNAFSRN